MRIRRRLRMTRSCILAVVSAAAIIVYLLSLSNGGSTYKRSSVNFVDIVADDKYKQLLKPALERPSDLNPQGLGEGGTAVRLPNLNPEDKQKMDKSIETYAVNQFISEKISLHRNLVDARHEL